MSEKRILYTQILIESFEFKMKTYVNDVLKQKIYSFGFLYISTILFTFK